MIDVGQAAALEDPAAIGLAAVGRDGWVAALRVPPRARRPRVLYVT